MRDMYRARSYSLLCSQALLFVSAICMLLQAMHAAEKAGFLPWTRDPAAFDLEAYQHYEQVFGVWALSAIHFSLLLGTSTQWRCLS